MREFIIILCLAFVQAARLGNNYGHTGTRNNAIESRSRQRGNTVSTTSSRSNGAQLSNGRSRSPAVTTQSIPSETNYDKVFYSYSAPEEDLNDIEAAQRLALAMRKNLRVIFIKAPENNGLTNAVLQLAQQNAESKTAIYVLAKQTDAADLANQFKDIQYSKETKPDVHFIKYRTGADAIRAQQLIQSEYEALGGSSRVSNENVAPVLNFVSQGMEAAIDNDAGHTFSTSSNSYFPSKTRN